jgi:hypothetical protein
MSDETFLAAFETGDWLDIDEIINRLAGLDDWPAGG